MCWSSSGINQMETTSKYYDGARLLSMMDINGQRPEIYLCTTNRSAGKTTYFARLLVNRFIKSGEKFCLLYRFNYELDSIADKFFRDINGLFFPGWYMTAKRQASGLYQELFLSQDPDDLGKSCGYAVALNGADQLKKYAHLLSDVCGMMFDEFQSETNHYCSDEIRKLLSIHTSIARGQGEQVRYVPVYMLSNAVSIINPYYVELGISERLRVDTKFLRGDGFVLEQGYNEAASAAQQTSGFNRAFAANQYVAYAAQNIYLNDSTAFVETPKGKNRYIATLRYNGTDFGIREFTAQGFVYCDASPDMSFPLRISVSTDDHAVNYVMLRRADLFLQNLRYYFDHGAFRFQNLKCKNAILKALSY